MKKQTPRKKSGKEVITTRLLDQLLREVIILRDKGRCQRCGQTQRLSPHHIFSKKKGIYFRYLLINVILLCFYCHIRVAHENPELFRDFIIPYLGQDVYFSLKQEAYGGGKHPVDRALIKNDLLALKLLFESNISL